MLEILPIKMIVFTGTGIQDNVAHKAGKLGIPLFDFGRSRMGVTAGISPARRNDPEFSR